jgi:hypothetical protein
LLSSRWIRIKRFYQKYRNYILLNKSILFSGIFAFFGGAMFTQLYSRYDPNSLSNSIATLTIEYAIYIPLFALFFYMDNRNRYVDPSTGRKSRQRVISDVKKLLAAFSVSEIIYSFSKIAIHFKLLESSIVEPYQASMIGSLAAWAVFLFSINLSVKAVKLFRS